MQFCWFDCAGSGKTSLVRILGGWHLPGSVTVAYQPNIPMQELGYVAEDDFLPVTETVYEVRAAMQGSAVACVPH